MLKNKKNILIAVLLVLIIQTICLVYSAGETIPEEFSKIVSFDKDKIDYTFSENMKEITLTFVEEGGVVNIKGNKFENVLPADKSLFDSFIRADTEGNILEADLTANEKGATYIINGVTFYVPPKTRMTYNSEEGIYFLESGIKVEEILPSSFKEKPINIRGGNIKILNDLLLDDALCSVNKNGILVQEGIVFYNGMKIDIPSNSGGILIPAPDFNLFDYGRNYIQQKQNSVKIQSSAIDLINLEFLEGDKIFNINNSQLTNPNQEYSLSMLVSGGDSVEIFNKKNEDNCPKMIYTSGKGKTIINNGRHTFKFENENYYSELGNLNTKNLISVPLKINSDVLRGHSLAIDDDNGYIIYDEQGNKFAFDKSLFTHVDYDFKSKISKKIYSFAEDQVGNSAFVWKGRGDVYYENYPVAKKIPVEGIKGYDCIGLIQVGLAQAYSGTSFEDFPPNLQLVNTLKKKGWSNYVISPSSIAGDVTKDSVKNIPAGSITFLMHPNYNVPDGKKGVNYLEYINENGQLIYLMLGHSLIRGTNEKNFINAVGGYEELIPRTAKEYDKNRDIPLFGGAVKEGNLIPEEDYLLVISPPND